jgi:hypothetical protein
MAPPLTGKSLIRIRLHLRDRAGPATFQRAAKYTACECCVVQEVANEVRPPMARSGSFGNNKSCFVCMANGPETCDEFSRLSIIGILRHLQ